MESIHFQEDSIEVIANGMRSTYLFEDAEPILDDPSGKGPLYRSVGGTWWPLKEDGGANEKLFAMPSVRTFGMPNRHYDLRDMPKAIRAKEYFESRILAVKDNPRPCVHDWETHDFSRETAEGAFARMRYVQWIEWARGITGPDIPHGIYNYIPQRLTRYKQEHLPDWNDEAAWDAHNFVAAFGKHGIYEHVDFLVTPLYRFYADYDDLTRANADQYILKNLEAATRLLDEGEKRTGRRLPIKAYYMPVFHHGGEFKERWRSRQGMYPKVMEDGSPGHPKPPPVGSYLINPADPMKQPFIPWSSMERDFELMLDFPDVECVVIWDHSIADVNRDWPVGLVDKFTKYNEVH